MLFDKKINCQNLYIYFFIPFLIFAPFKLFCVFINQKSQCGQFFILVRFTLPRVPCGAPACVPPNIIIIIRARANMHKQA